MTDDELKAIEERAKAATPGPWKVVPADLPSRLKLPERVGGIYGPKPPRESWMNEDDWEMVDEARIVETDGGHYPPAMPDAEFIAHAREDVPALIAEVRRLNRALVDRTMGFQKTVLGTTCPKCGEVFRP